MRKLLNLANNTHRIDATTKCDLPTFAIRCVMSIASTINIAV